MPEQPETAWQQEATYQGDTWVLAGEYPRLIAESFRRLLDERGVVSVIRTPFQWVLASPVIEIETGGYMGSVGLYVPKVQAAEAEHWLQGSGA